MQNRIDKVLNEQGKTYKDLVPLTGLSEYGIGKMAQVGDDETFGAWLSIARALDVSPAYLVGWSDEEEEQSSVEKQQHWYESQMGQLKAYADKMVEPLKNIKIPAPTPTHGVKVTLDDGQIIYDSREMDDMDAYSLAGDWVYLNDCKIAKSHIVSIEKVEEG
ncbi:helix-turn-helix domain-containing protein [Limosilactobacillus oris]|uniref:helix-turn-helix domain-containing protein n=1 Tax=Limosilactobacillus oris TaxID=1632 RepID=UPI00188419FF|nr:hypothetical protein [Limosilactobacillus oris]MBF0600839.1 hypothetical protein [Limosilactobacillus oris]